jgi:hypothetical protein
VQNIRAHNARSFLSSLLLLFTLLALSIMSSALIANAAYPTIFVGHGQYGIAFDSANYLLFGGISYKKK